ncbi:hypothetical protein GCM10010201_04090 [Pilimelia columellifera subsp. columellifera]|uniref:Uncharacterized protein n=1 Tax=Pilimelia columellifera subsp. columellifera TaxID=706583 RepID=A0ABN3N057_9ACTN
MCLRRVGNATRHTDMQIPNPSRSAALHDAIASAGLTYPSATTVTSPQPSRPTAPARGFKSAATLTGSSPTPAVG